MICLLLWSTKYGMHGVPNHFIDGTMPAKDNSCHFIQVLVEQGYDDSRRKRFNQRSKVSQVGKHKGQIFTLTIQI